MDADRYPDYYLPCPASRLPGPAVRFFDHEYILESDAIEQDKAFAKATVRAPYDDETLKVIVG